MNEEPPIIDTGQGTGKIANLSSGVKDEQDSPMINPGSPLTSSSVKFFAINRLGSAAPGIRAWQARRDERIDGRWWWLSEMSDAERNSTIWFVARLFVLTRSRPSREGIGASLRTIHFRTFGSALRADLPKRVERPTTQFLPQKRLL